MKITIINPVECQVSTADKKVLSPCLSHEAEFWRQGKFSKKRKVYRKNVISKEGRFLFGLLPKVLDYCELKNIDVELVGGVEELAVSDPDLSGVTWREAEDWDYQLELIHKAVAAKRGVVKGATGIGKTMLALGVAACFKDARVLILAHTKTIVTQTRKKVAEVQLDKRIDVDTVQKFYRKDPEEYWDKYDVVIIDECFSKDSPVRMSRGTKSIQNVKVGDLVWSRTGIEKVTHTFRRRVSLDRIVKLDLSNGKVVFCSKDHLFCTPDGFIEARYLKGRTLVDLSLRGVHDEKNWNSKRVSELWKKVSRSQLEQKSKILFQKLYGLFQKAGSRSLFYMRSNISTERKNSEVLLKELSLQGSRTETYMLENGDQNQSGASREYKRKNAKQQSHGKAKNYRKNVEYQKEQWHFAYLVRQAWRKWNSFKTTSALGYCFKLAYGGWDCFSPTDASRSEETMVKVAQLPHFLQGRYREQKTKNWYRSRWKFPFYSKRRSPRSEKDGQTEPVRVESVEIYKRGDNDRSFQGVVSHKQRNQGFVEFYDLEVENAHSYFVEDVLVHNCHHVTNPDGMYAKVLRSMAAPVRLGFTATLPSDVGARLNIEGFLGPVIGEITIQTAVEWKILSEPKVEIIRVPLNTRLRGIKKWPDVYDAGIVHSRSRNRLVVKVAKEAIERGESVLILVIRIDHGQNIVDTAKRLYDLDLVYVQGATDANVREDIRIAMEEKRVKGVVATVVFREGLDIPSLDVVVNAGLMRSELMTLQAIGRGLRRTSEKTRVRIVDFFDPSHHYLISHFGERLCLFMDNKWL